MKKGSPNSFAQQASALLMMFALVWLSISLPFVYASQQKIAQQQVLATADLQSGDDPYSQVNEEKSESGNGTIAEYLTELLHLHHPFTVLTKIFNGHSADVYLAFHPEMISPPPEH